MGDIVISPAAAIALTSLGGVIATVVTFLYRAMIAQYEARLAEHKETTATKDALLKDQTVALQEQTVALNKLLGAVEAWRTTTERTRRARDGA